MPVRVYEALTEIEAGMIESLLRANGIHPFELQKSSQVYLAGIDTNYYVEVPDHEAAAAREILKEFEVAHLAEPNE